MSQIQRTRASFSLTPQSDSFLRERQKTIVENQKLTSAITPIILFDNQKKQDEFIEKCEEKWRLRGGGLFDATLTDGYGNKRRAILTKETYDELITSVAKSATNQLNWDYRKQLMQMTMLIVTVLSCIYTAIRMISPTKEQPLLVDKQSGEMLGQLGTAAAFAETIKHAGLDVWSTIFPILVTAGLLQTRDTGSSWFCFKGKTGLFDEKNIRNIQSVSNGKFVSTVQLGSVEATSGEGLPINGILIRQLPLAERLWPVYVKHFVNLKPGKAQL